MFLRVQGCNRLGAGILCREGPDQERRGSAGSSLPAFAEYVLQRLHCCLTYSVDEPRRTDSTTGGSKMDVGYWRSSRDVLWTDYLGPSCDLVHRAGATRLKPDGPIPCRYSVHGRGSDDAIHRDACRARQSLPIQVIRRLLTSSWWIAGLVSVIVFTAMHGCTDRFAVTILLGAMVLSAVFAIEAKRNGRPVLCTYLTHVAANSKVFSLQFL